MADERRLDGNAIGGLMLELFGVEMTTATGVCRTCGAADLVARLEVYMDAPGTVVRCAHCRAVLMRIVRAPDRTWLDFSGLRSIELPRQMRHQQALADQDLRWTDSAWLREAEAWIRERASVTGPLDQFHVRWWSTVIRVPTEGEDLYFKAVANGFMFEPALTARLFELSPDRVTALVDVDLDRGWMLMRDAGRRLREVVLNPAELRHWELALPRYAELQLAATPVAGELLALGVPDARLSVLPGQLRAVLARPVRGLSLDHHKRTLAALPEFEAMCRELAAYGISETIQHDDLHDGQVFLRDGHYLFFDWGDSCISHPFHSLTVTLRAAAAKFDLKPGGREVQRLRDAYLEPFGDLQAAADLAYRTGTVARALAWDRFVRSGFPYTEPDDDLATAYGLKLFLENGPIGSWREP